MQRRLSEKIQLLSQTQVALLSSLWQGMVTSYAIIFVVYTVQLDYWLRKDTAGILDSGGRYFRSFVAIILIELSALGAVLICLWGLWADDPSIVPAAAIYSSAAIIAMFGFLISEVFTSAAAGLAGWMGGVRSNDPKRRQRAMNRTKSIDPVSGERKPVKDLRVILEGEPGAEDE